MLKREVQVLLFFIHKIKTNELLITGIILMGQRVIGCRPLMYRQMQYLGQSFLILDKAVVSTVRPLLGTRRNGHKTLYLFQKHLICWECVPRSPVSDMTVCLKLRAACAVLPPLPVCVNTWRCASMHPRCHVIGKALRLNDSYPK